jgi:hydroxymethylpyrimidine/phosphomethylpyrimidine kinase
VKAVKIGMLSQPAIIETVADGLDRHGARAVVLDPVMIAASGDPLLRDEAVETLIERLMPMALVATPNLPEAARLTGQPVAEGRAEMLRQGEAMLAMGPRAVLLKGGHAGGGESTDLLLSAEGPVWFTAPRHPTENTHGTGCTLSSAIAAELALGHALTDSVALAKEYVTAAIKAADGLHIGHGHGPVHHFHAWWQAG